MNRLLRPIAALAVFALALPAQQLLAQQDTVIKSNADEVILDVVVRDKKGKPVDNLKADDLTVSDNGVKQQIRSFRLVQGAEAISATGAHTPLDPLHQVRLVTLAFDAMSEADQRKTARAAALDLVKGNQGTNVYYSVVVVNTRLLVLQQFTKDVDALSKAIDEATNNLSSSKLIAESDSIKNEISRNIPRPADGTTDPVTNAIQVIQSAQPAVAGGPGTNTAAAGAAIGEQKLQAVFGSIMLAMLDIDTQTGGQDTRLSLAALKALVQAMQPMPGRKSILYFNQGMYLPQELDQMFKNLVSAANRANTTFYTVDTRGVMTFSQNSGARDSLNSAADLSATTTTRRDGGTTKDEMKSEDRGLNSARANTQLPMRDLAEDTGGFLIGDSNDLRVPLRKLNEEISSYYEITYNPGIKNYDGSFRKLSVEGRKDLVIHARNGYFALPPEARSAGLQAFEMPILKALSDGKLSTDVEFRSGALVLQPKAEGADVYVLTEVPLRTLQPKLDPVKNTQNIRFSIAALIKDPSGAVVQKLSQDRSLQVTADQLKMGNFLEKMSATVPPGKYTLESAAMDLESGKIGVQKSAFTVEPKGQGVRVSSIAAMKGYAPAAKDLDANEPFQFQGGLITPTLNTTIVAVKDALLRLFFVVYQDSSITAKPTVEIEFIQNGKSLTKAPLPLPDADKQGRIPYVMTIGAEAIPPGTYEVKVNAAQGSTAAQSATMVTIAPK